MKTKLLLLLGFVLSFTVSFHGYGQTYCTPTFAYGAGSACGQTYPFHITAVSLGTLNATGMVANGCSGASTFQLMSQTGNVTAGQTYTLSVSRYSAGYTVRATVYADWNHNGTLNDAGETLIAGVSFGSGTTLTANVTVPAAAYIGTTRLRVVVRYNAAIAGPCTIGSALSQGETKDFNFTILASCTSPASQATLFALNALTTSSCDVGWTRGSGDAGVIVVARQGAAPTADPVSGTTYTADPSYTGGGSAIGGGKVVYIGSGTNVNVTGLTAGQTCYFSVYEYNSAGTCYKTPGLQGSVAIPTCLPPTAQSTSFTSANILTTTADIGWTRAVSGGGDNVLVVARLGSAPNADPVNGSSYSADPGFGLGSQIGTGNYVVYAGPGTSVSLSGLLPSSDYYFKVYEYYTSGSCYNTGGPLQGSFTTASCSPASDATSYSGASNPAGTEITVSFTRGSGSRVLVVARQGSAVTTTGPSIYNQDFSGISGIGNGTFAYGTGAAQIGSSGNYVVYDGTGNTVTVTGTTPGATYYFAVFEYDASPNCYSAAPLTGSTAALNPMTFVSMTSTQVTGNVAPSATNQQIIRVDVVTTGGTVPALTTNSITFNTNGTTLASADISNVRIFYTGTSSTFATTTQFGSTVTGTNIPSGTTTYTLSGSQNLAVGTNYFWIAYDIGPYPGCTLGDLVDAECTGAELSSSFTGTLNPVPTVTAPSGNRSIQLTYCTPVNSGGYTACGCFLGCQNFGIGTVSIGSTNIFTNTTCYDVAYTDYYNTYSGSVTNNQTTTITVNRTGTDYASYIYVYVDWNYNGVFTDAGEQIVNTYISGLSTGAVSFTVPNSSGAPPGPHRMRVVDSYGTPVNSCQTNQGQTYDFKLIVLAPSPMVYASSTVTQNTATVAPGATNQQVIGIEVVTTGSLSPISLTQLDLNITGTSLAADITNAKVYYTGTSPTFATTSQYGSTVTSPSGSFSVTGSQALSGGTDYFWLAFDVSGTATPGNVLDAECTQITVGGTNYIPTVTAPTGNRMILISGTNAPPGIPILYYDMELNTARSTLDLTPEQNVNANSNVSAGGYTASATTGAGIYNGGSISGAALYGPRPATSSSTPIASPTISNPAYYIQIPLNTSGFKGIGFKFNVFCHDGTGGGDWPYADFIYSTNGGTNWYQGGYWATSADVWQTANGTLPATCDDNPNVLIRIYGYYASSASSTVSIDNFQMMAQATTTNAGTKTLTDFTAIYTGMTSGLTGSLYLYDVFTATGSGTTVNLTKSNLALTGGLWVSNGATFNFGTAATPTSLLAQAGTFTAYPTANIGITSNAGIMSNPGIYGNVQCTGTRAYSSLANYNYMGGTTQNTGDGLPVNVNNLTINNPTGVILTNSSVQVNGSLNLTNGVFSTGGIANKIIIGNTGNVSRTNGWVYGDLQKPVNIGSNVLVNFEIGNLNSYTPLTLTFPGITTSGNITSRVNVGNHPNLGSICLSNTKNVNQYWTVVNSGVLPLSYDASFGYTPAEIIGGANAANFLAGQYKGGNWTMPALNGVPTTTGTQVSGLTDVGDFQIAESSLITAAVSISANPSGPVCPGVNIDFTATPVNGGSTPSYLWKLNGANVGTNSPVYSNSNLANNDQLIVVMTSSDVCSNPPGTAMDTALANIAVCGQSWTGLVSSDWNTAGNWTGNTVPTSVSDVTIPAGTPYQPVITNAATCQALTINAGASVTINPGYTLTASGPTTLNGTQCLIIKTNATANGSFIDNGTVLGSGSGRLERYITAGIWHYISSPVPTQTAAAFNGQYVKKWLEPTYSWQNVISSSELLSVMKGYAVKTNQSKVYNLVGRFNTGLKSFPLTRTNSLPGTKRGWNLIGNPYPSFIDWDAPTGWSRANVDNAVYIYNQFYANYATYSGGIGVNGGSRYIAPGQGFFVLCNSPGGAASISMDNAVRTHSSASFLKSAELSDVLRISLTNGHYSDETALHFFAGASADYDNGQDAMKIIDNAYSQIWFQPTETPDLKLSIAALPELPQVTAVPLAFSPSTSGTFSLTVSGMESFINPCSLYLEDRIMGSITDLSENPSYTFEGNPGQDVNRFMLHFTLPAAAISEISSSSDKYSIYPNPNNGKFTLRSTSQITGDNMIEVVNLLGEKLYYNADKRNGMLEIDLAGISAGIYYLKITTRDRTETIKFVVSE